MEGLVKFLFLMLLGGFIALVGDRIGKYFGKKKLTIFNLRPRYTSMIFTFIYGMMISLVTIGILALISGNVRIALLGVHELELRRQKLEDDIQQLARITTVNELVFHVNQPIAMAEIEGGRPAAEVESKLDQLMAQANHVAITRYNEAGRVRDMSPIDPGQHLVVAEKVDYNQAVQYLSKTPKDFVVLVYALQNSYLREPVPVRIGFVENKRVFRAGQAITQMKIDGKQPADKILVELFQLLSQLQQTALRSGMIPNPQTNDFGGNILVATLLDKRDQITAIAGPAVVRVIANRDLYSIGPLDVRFDVQPGGG